MKNTHPSAPQYTEIELKKMLIAEMGEQAKTQGKTYQFENNDIWTLMCCDKMAALKACKLLGLVANNAKIKQA